MIGHFSGNHNALGHFPFSAVIAETLISLDSVLNSHYKLAKTIFFPGDFEIPFDVNTDGSAGTTAPIFGGTDALTWYIRDSKLQVQIPTPEGSVYKGVLISVDKLVSCKVGRSGDSFYLTTDLGTVTIDVPNAEPISVSYIGKWSSNYFEDIISKTKFIDKSGAEYVVTTFKLNQGTSNIEYSQENVFGAELITNNVFDDATDWLDARGTATLSVVDNKLRATADAANTYGQSTALSGLIIGEAYIFKGVATTNNPVATIRFRVGSTQALNENDILTVQGNSTISIESSFVATAETMYAGTINTGHNSGDYVDVEMKVSVRRLQGNASIYVNIPESKRVSFTFTDDGWLGEELITQNIWENPFSAANQWAFDVSSNNWEYTGDGSNSAMQPLPSSAQPNIGILSLNVVAISGVMTATASTGNSFTNTGEFKFIFDKTTDSTQQFKRKSGVASATLDKPSFKRLIEVA